MTQQQTEKMDSDVLHTSILTVGYGKLSIDEFCGLLHKRKVTYLVDVRSRPYSKYQPDYSRESIEQTLQQCGIKYVFMGELLGGMPSDPDCYQNGKVSYEDCRTKSFHKAGIARLRRAWEQKLPIAVMCACGKPQLCHRSKLIGVSLLSEGIPVLHMDDEGQVCTQEDIAEKLSAMPDLFGFIGEMAASRKRYLK